MLKISNIPNEIYYTACQYEDIPINLEQLDKAEKSTNMKQQIEDSQMED